MNRKVAIIVALQALLIIVMFWVIIFYGKDEYEAYTREQDEEIASPERVSSELGATVITISAEAQAQSDISTTELKTGSHQETLSAFGSVISIDPLIEMRTRYLTAVADANVARASLANSQQEYQRLLQLNQDNRNVSDRVVLASQALYKTDQAKLQAAQVQADNVRDNMRQLWGETLAMQATQSNSSALQNLLQYREVLVQVTLPFDAAAPRTGDTVWVSPTGSQGKAIRAVYVSPSPQTDATLQGKTYYYRAPADNLRAGMRTSVSSSVSSPVSPSISDPVGNTANTASTKDSAHQQGVIVPASAVVWYGGKAWIYRKQGQDKFTRLPIPTNQQHTDGWFSDSGLLKPGDEVVTSGAQLLLSEEFKYQIKNENED